jgi:hypothetical protein
VYVHLEGPLTREAWFEGLSQGRCFVTNGPLLVVKANQKWPGAIFKTDKQKPLAIELEIEVTSNDPISRLELIQNGRVTQTVDCSADVTQKKSFTLTVSEPGWFLVRALANVKETFRFASAGPWHVETPEADRRIERQSAQFFLDWTDERIARVERNLAGTAELREILQPHEQAREFWQQRVNKANFD